jgi:hypothetical protein
MTEMIDLKSSQPTQYDPRPQYFVKMLKDGTVISCELVARGREEADQNTMELEYLPQPLTDEEKIKFQVEVFKAQKMLLSDDMLLVMAKESIKHPDFKMPDKTDYNSLVGARVHDDPEYFFKTPAKPVIWTFKRGTPEEAKGAAETYRQSMLKPLKSGQSKWDMVIAVYKQQYNVVEG